MSICTIGIFLFWNCSSKDDSLEQQDIHYTLLKDLYLADALVIKQPNHLRDSLRKIYLGQIAVIHGLSTQSIDSIMLSLQQNLPLYKQVSDSVLIQLNDESKLMNSKPSQKYSK